MKKILAVFHDNNLYSGATQSFLSNIEYLNTQGHNIHAVIPCKNGDLEKRLKELNIAYTKTFYGGCVFSDKARSYYRVYCYVRCFIKYLISKISAFRLAYNIRKEKIQLVYSNTSTIYFGAYLSEILHIPHYWHFREFVLEDQSSVRLFESEFKRYSGAARTIITISNILDQYYREKYSIDNSIVLYNDLSEKYIIEGKRAHQGLNVLITGTICPEKGQLVALKALQYLNNESITLYIAGAINSYALYLKKYVQDNNIKNIVFCGFMRDMKALRKNIDVSIVASRKEAFGRTIIEDMLSNIVVVGCDTGAVSELIKDGVTGYLYEYGNYKSLASKLEKISQDKASLDSILKKSFSFAKHFTTNKTAICIDKMIREL